MKPKTAFRAALLSMHTDPLAPLGGDVAGGMNVYVRELARALSRQGVRVDVFTRMSEEGAPDLIEIAPGARMARVPAGPRRDLHKGDLFPLTGPFAEGIEAFAARQGARYNIVSAHYWLSGVAGALLARRWGVPLALRFHTLGLQKNRSLPSPNGHESSSRIFAEGGLAQEAEALFASSAAEAEMLHGDLGAAESRIHVVPCGVDLERFASVPREAARAALGVKKEDILILSVGRVEPVKGLDRLIEVIAHLKALRPGLPLRAIHVGGAVRNGNGRPSPAGLGPEDFTSSLQRAEVRRILRMAQEKGVSELAFVGAKLQEELPRFYSAADALAIPSRYETFGLVALESAACGLPAVAFDVGGLSHSIEAGVSGQLVPDGNIGAFTEALLWMLEASGARKRVGQQARERARAFPWAAVAARELAIWKRLIPQRSAPPPVFLNGGFSPNEEYPAAETLACVGGSGI